LRDPRCGFLSALCRTLIFFRLGLEITKVPLPDIRLEKFVFRQNEFSCGLIDHPL